MKSNVVAWMNIARTASARPAQISRSRRPMADPDYRAPRPVGASAVREAPTARLRRAMDPTNEAQETARGGAVFPIETPLLAAGGLRRNPDSPPTDTSGGPAPRPLPG